LHIERLVPPHDISQEIENRKSECPNFELGGFEVIDGAGDELHDKPGRLKHDKSFRYRIAFAPVVDLLCCQGASIHPAHISLRTSSGCSVVGFLVHIEYETTHQDKEAVRLSPRIISGCTWTNV
jgi:hypothetical protein